jgi:hypothetical protein
MTLREYVVAQTGNLNLLVEIARIYRFSFDLFDRVDSKLQGFPIDVLEAIAVALPAQLGDLIATVPSLAPPGVMNRVARNANLTPVYDKDNPTPIRPPMLPSLRLAMTSNPIIIPLPP